jgi:hypothetical protein
MVAAGQYLVEKRWGKPLRDAQRREDEAFNRSAAEARRRQLQHLE